MASHRLYKDIVDTLPFNLWVVINMIRIQFIRAGKNVTELLIDTNQYSLNIEKSKINVNLDGHWVLSDVFTIEVFHVNVPGICIYEFKFYVVQESKLVLYRPSLKSSDLISLNLYKPLNKMISNWTYGTDSLAPLAWINKYLNPSR